MSEADAGVALDRSRLHELMGLADPTRALQAEEGLQSASEALALARTLGQEEDAAKAGAWLARHCLHLGRFQSALEHATDILQREASTASLEVRVQAMCVIALAGCELPDFERALDAAQALMSLTSRVTDADTSLGAAFSMAACFDRMGDSWQAVRLLSEALADHASLGSDRAVLTASNALCAVCPRVVHLLRDCGAETERHELLVRGREAGELALRLAEAQSNPTYAIAVKINLSETLIAQQELARATELLRGARDAARSLGLQPYAWLAEVNLADALLRQGGAAQALQSTEALLAEMGPDAPAATVAQAHELAYRACKALSRFETALQHFEQAERLERLSLTNRLRIQSRLFVTRSEERRARDQAAQAQQEAQRQHEAAARFAADAECDPLTQLGNRRHLDRRASELLRVQVGAQQPLALAQIDIDHFKKVNDEHGHEAGDAVLVALSGLLRSNSRSVDVLVRNGGEEFVIVLPNTRQDVAVEVCERLRARIEEMVVALPDGGSLKITVSIGLAVAPPYDLAALLRAADAALYAAKRGGRNRLCLE